eukprot:1314279-Amphidinium_carterae.1
MPSSTMLCLRKTSTGGTDSQLRSCRQSYTSWNLRFTRLGIWNPVLCPRGNRDKNTRLLCEHLEFGTLLANDAFIPELLRTPKRCMEFAKKRYE